MLKLYISVPALVLLVTSFALFGGIVVGQKENTTQILANGVSAKQLIYPEKTNPYIFLDENGHIIFLDGQEKIVGNIDVSTLNINNILGVTKELVNSDWPKNTYISPVVLERSFGTSMDIFYFSATNSYNCGASNCTWILYRFNSVSKKLTVLDDTIFGQILGLYLSPNSKVDQSINLDGQKILWTAGDSGGYCLGGGSAGVINLSTLQKTAVPILNATKYEYVYMKNALWKDGHIIQFTTHYQNNMDCLHASIKEVIWSYDASL